MEKQPQPSKKPDRVKDFKYAWPMIARIAGIGIGVGNFAAGSILGGTSSPEAYGFAALLLATPFSARRR